MTGAPDDLAPDVAARHHRLLRAIAAAAALACLVIASLTVPNARAAVAAAPSAAPTVQRGPAISPSDFPNDPGFAPCESQDPVTGCGDNEQWQLFGPLKGNTCLAAGGTVADQPHPDGGLPCWATGAHDPDHAAGVDITGAWEQGNFGRGDVRIAHIEGGVNYSSDGVKDALDNIYLNQGELPYPEGSNGHDRGRYDFDGNGRFDIRDYAQDPRVNPPCPSGTAPFGLSDRDKRRRRAFSGEPDAAGCRFARHSGTAASRRARARSGRSASLSGGPSGGWHETRASRPLRARPVIGGRGVPASGRCRSRRQTTRVESRRSRAGRAARSQGSAQRAGDGDGVLGSHWPPSVGAGVGAGRAYGDAARGPERVARG